MNRPNLGEFCCTVILSSYWYQYYSELNDWKRTSFISKQEFYQM